jgi:hypothetical protein
VDLAVILHEADGLGFLGFSHGWKIGMRRRESESTGTGFEPPPFNPRRSSFFAPLCSGALPLERDVAGWRPSALWRADPSWNKERAGQFTCWVTPPSHRSSKNGVAEGGPASASRPLRLAGTGAAAIPCGLTLSLMFPFCSHA